MSKINLIGKNKGQWSKGVAEAELTFIPKKKIINNYV